VVPVSLPPRELGDEELAPCIPIRKVWMLDQSGHFPGDVGSGQRSGREGLRME
jgi:hypothetical protein